MQAMFEDVSARFASDPRVTVHRTTSDVAPAPVPEGRFDRVHVDGNRSEPFVADDLAVCRRMVCRGASSRAMTSTGRPRPAVRR